MLSILFFLLLSTAVSAQDPAKSLLAPCGTPPGVDPWLRAFMQQPTAASDRTADTLYAALQVHLLANDNGGGRFAPGRLLDALCRLNTDFAASGIQFFLKNDWNNIDNTAWWQHETIPQGIDLMLTNNVSDALNTYFVSDPAGNCGYNLPYAGVAIAHDCGGAQDHTWAHEVGHALSLPHPFLGWDGNSYNFNQPTPTVLTYDYTYFHDSLETQVPAPLDTALVENLDGSNCAIAADLFCDTKPDYLSYRWDCDDQNNSLVKQRDPNGLEFYSDGTLFMSYAADVCQNRFSLDQTIAMRANLQTEKAAWLHPGAPPPAITTTAVPADPVDGFMVPSNAVELRWAATPGATHYLVQVTRIASFAIKEFEMMVADTSVMLPQLIDNKLYYWRVKPFSFWSFCADLSPAETFLTTAPVTAAAEADADGWRCYPTVLAAGQSVTLETPAAWHGRPARFALYDLTGRLCWESTAPPAPGRMRLALPEGLAAGMYCLVARAGEAVKVERLVVANKVN
jgi:hypothetical protein